MTEKRKPGRPKHWIKDPPEHIKALADGPDMVTNQLLEGTKQLERLLRDGEPIGMPTQLLAELNDFDCLSRTDQQVVLTEYRKRIADIKKAQQKGKKSTKQKAYDRGLKICGKNKSLIQRIRPNGHLTVHGVAKRIRDEWAERGDGGTAPSINTLSTYIKQHLQRHA